jgi:hypothetical protein
MHEHIVSAKRVAAREIARRPNGAPGPPSSAFDEKILL